jgi:hypothetical protein
MSYLSDKMANLEQRQRERIVCNGETVADMKSREEALDQNALEHGSMMPAREAYEIIEMDALARNIVHYAKNSVMPFEQVVQVTKERLEKAFREFSARPNPKPSNDELNHDAANLKDQSK